MGQRGTLSDENLINYWQEFLQTPYTPTNVPDWFDKLQSVVQSQEESDSDPHEQVNTTREEWMFVTDPNTLFDSSGHFSESTHGKQTAQDTSVRTVCFFQGKIYFFVEKEQSSKPVKTKFVHDENQDCTDVLINKDVIVQDLNNNDVPFSKQELVPSSLNLTD